MIAFLRNWANQIIVALIIATILEMIIPNGKNKKYIKMMIGLYVLFTMIQPVITKVMGNSLELASFDYHKYFDEPILETSFQDFENHNSKLIEQAYIDNIKNDIAVKIKQKGYEVIHCNIGIVNNTNASNYGALERIQIQVKKMEETIEESNTIQIEKVEVAIENEASRNNNIEEKTNLSEKEKTKLIEYLSNEYSVDKTKVMIN